MWLNIHSGTSDCVLQAFLGGFRCSSQGVDFYYKNKKKITNENLCLLVICLHISERLILNTLLQELFVPAPVCNHLAHSCRLCCHSIFHPPKHLCSCFYNNLVDTWKKYCFIVLNLNELFLANIQVTITFLIDLQPNKIYCLSLFRKACLVSSIFKKQLFSWQRLWMLHGKKKIG